MLVKKITECFAAGHQIQNLQSELRGKPLVSSDHVNTVQRRFLPIPTRHGCLMRMGVNLPNPNVTALLTFGFSFCTEVTHTILGFTNHICEEF